MDNLKRAAGSIALRPRPPLLIASPLLVSGYIDEQEVADLARYLARIDADMPYSLLGFYPQLMINDLPPTSKAQASACLEAARAKGPTKVRIDNRHVLV